MGNRLTRRDLLRKSAGAMLTAAGFSVTRDVLAQVTGSMPVGGTVPLRMPAGALDYLDRKQYIHNMEIHAHVQPTAGGGEPWPMWARGKQRSWSALPSKAAAACSTSPSRPGRC